MADSSEREAINHEGMVTVWNHDGTYAGCLGAETWKWLLAHREVDAPALERLTAAEQDNERLREGGRVEWQLRHRAEAFAAELDAALAQMREVVLLAASGHVPDRAVLTTLANTPDDMISDPTLRAVLRENERAEARVTELTGALRFIAGETHDSPSVWLTEYRAHGGRYEGLQAVARAVLGSRPHQEPPA